MKLRLQRDGRTFDSVGLQRLGSGGEAHVYVLPGTPWAAKVYHGPVIGRDAKLRVMLDNPPIDPTVARGHVSIAWPQDLLIDPHGRIVGYVMPLVARMRRLIEFYNPKTRRKECPLFTYKYLATTALNLAIAVRALHQRGYVMGDVNESNILVAETTLVTLVDTDSFQVREPGNGRIHRCTVGSPLFTPREMQGMDFTLAVRRAENDLFGLGVLLFHLLMEGSHPFQVRFTGAGDSPEPVEVIRGGHFPHDTGSAMWQPPPLAPPFGMLDARLRGLFTRCFVNGHRDQNARPTADEWCSNLASALGILVQCRANPSHLFWPHVKGCPWCERAVKLSGRDPFPPPISERLGEYPAPQKTTVRRKAAAPANPHTRRVESLAGASANDLAQAAIGDLRIADLGGGVKLLLCGVPPGIFNMGEPRGGYNKSRKVTLTKGFWLGQKQVTQGQWQELIGSNPSKFKGANLPVENVNWADAMTFCAKLNEMINLPSGWRWALPTEAQWEYACRAGTKGEFSGILDEMAWYNSNSNWTSHAVATKMANAWGLYDMHGNVWEWCADWNDFYRPEPSTDPIGPNTGLRRLLRGGGWCHDAGSCRSAYRLPVPSDSRFDVAGFRVAAVPVDK